MLKKISVLFVLFSFLILGLSAKNIAKNSIKPKQVENINLKQETDLKHEVKKGNEPVPKELIEKSKKTSSELETIVGKIKIANKHIMGRIGDRSTALRLTAMGYTKLRSKTTSIHGIDGVYIRKKNGKIEILIVENKTNFSQLSVDKRGNKQLSDAWVKSKINEMINNKNQRTRNTGLMLKSYYEKNPKSIEKQLWNYDLTTGKTEVWVMDKNANYTTNKPKWSWEKDKVLIKTLNEIKKGGVQ